MTTLPTLEDLARLFRIEPELGKVFWANAAGTKASYFAEREAGFPKHSRRGKIYHTIKIDGRPIGRGRLIFLFVHGHWPHPVLDHINGDSTDDRIANLREATIRENARNKKKYGTKLLPMGVTNSRGLFLARIRTPEQVLNLGTFKTAEEAASAYRAKRLEVFGDFA